MQMSFQYYPGQIIFIYSAIFVGLFLIVGIIYFNRFPTLESWRLKRIRKEFHKQQTLSAFKDYMEYNEKFAEFIMEKYPDEFT